MKEPRKKKLYVVMDVLCVVIGKSWKPGTELYVSIICLFFSSANRTPGLSATPRYDFGDAVSAFSACVFAHSAVQEFLQ